MSSNSLIKTIMLLLPLSFFVEGCGLIDKKAAYSGICSGTITYRITYPASVDANPMSFLFPSEMKTAFEGTRQKSEFKNKLNLYKLEFIFGNNPDSTFALLKLLEKRMVVPASGDAFVLPFMTFSPDRLSFINDSVKSIAGFDCKKAVYFTGRNDVQELSIWYTDQLGVEKPNRNTPFSEIPGIMLEFDVLYQGMQLHLEAISVVCEAHPREIFDVPANYEVSSITEIQALIDSVISR